MDGILNVFKPVDITSYGVIRELKRISGEKKIGHLGTLDPMAQGVLPLFLGKMTKLIPIFNVDNKVYKTSARLGARSTTLDREGEISAVPIPRDCSPEKIERYLRNFIGEINQTPPMYSAIKVKGKKLYEYARKGIQVKRKSRRVSIFDISHIAISMPEITFTVFCSKGTYIRSLVDDLGHALGTGCYLTALTRTRCGEFFSEENAVNLDFIKKMDETDLQKILIDPQCILSDWNVLRIASPEKQKHICQGRTVLLSSDEVRLSRLGVQFSNTMVKDQKDRLIAIGHLEFSQDSVRGFRPSKVFI